MVVTVMERMIGLLFVSLQTNLVDSQITLGQSTKGYIYRPKRITFIENTRKYIRNYLPMMYLCIYSTLYVPLYPPLLSFWYFEVVSAATCYR